MPAVGQTDYDKAKARKAEQEERFERARLHLVNVLAKEFKTFVDSVVEAHKESPPKTKWDEGYEAAYLEMQRHIYRMIAERRAKTA